MINYFFPLNIKVTLIPFKPTFSFAKRFFPKGSLPNLVVKTLTPHKTEIFIRRILRPFYFGGQRFHILPQKQKEMLPEMKQVIATGMLLQKQYPNKADFYRDIREFYRIGVKDSNVKLLNYDDKSKHILIQFYNAITVKQVTGLVSIHPKLKEFFNNPDEKDYTSCAKYIILKVCQILCIFRGVIKNETDFLVRFNEAFKSIDHTVPETLKKYFGSVAISQHLLNIMCAYKYYDKNSLDQLSENLIDNTSLEKECYSQQFIEQYVLLQNMGRSLRKNSNIKYFAVNPDNVSAISGYDTLEAQKHVNQPNADYFGKWLKVIQNSTEKYEITPGYRYHDIKAEHSHAMSQGRISVQEGFYCMPLNRAQQFLNNYISELRSIIKILNISYNNYNHRYIKLHNSLNENRIQLRRDNIRECLETNNVILVDAMENGIDLDISLKTDAGTVNDFIESFKPKILDTYEEKKIISVKIDPFFPADGQPNPTEIREIVKKLLEEFFPEEERESILENFDRYGTGSFALIIKDK